jgi:hypothetical protein
MDKETDIYVAPMNRVFDLIEGNDDADTVRLVKLKPEVGCGQLARYSNTQAAQREARIVGTLHLRDQARSVSITHG